MKSLFQFRMKSLFRVTGYGFQVPGSNEEPVPGFGFRVSSSKFQVSQRSFLLTGNS